MIYSPQQEVFNLCRRKAIEVFKEKNVYDSRPLKAVSYPFCEVSDQQTVEGLNKSTVIPTIYQTFHIFGDNKAQGQLRTLASALKKSLREVKNTKHYYVSVNKISERTLQDNSTSTPLFHLVLDVEFILY